MKTLRKSRAAEEERANLLGHLRGSETADRYCDPIDLENQLDVITRLPVLTGHLGPQPIHLIPWVERLEIAPWSNAAKQARKQIPVLEVKHHTTIEWMDNCVDQCANLAIATEGTPLGVQLRLGPSTSGLSC
ncbi:hypothetical protein GCM10007989_13210 [Devosia pacifica]|uniref:Uncharacterized protein n=1 Tax=Devosia pacifica TaxID=1335967 RepID=A0A918VS05_9HYPH|nr:hypothetical protein [Devosia pacifica]GHA19093.1 hypothetical protein GCM10007989_13210 [Devosia pacifica]